MSFFKDVYQYLSSPIAIGSFELPFSWFTLVLAAILIVLMYVAYRLLVIVLRKLVGRSRAQEKTKERVIRWTRLGFRVLLVLGVFAVIGWLLGARVFTYIGKSFGVLGQPIISSGATSISFLTLILTIPVFYIASWAGRVSRGFVDRSLLNRVGLDESRKFSISSLTRYGVMVLVVLVGLSVIGIDLSALAVLFGVLGIGVGFGLQDVVANFFAGLVIILTRPIKEGDRILVNELDGTVIHIRILSTVINTVTEETIILPNSLLVHNSVHNYSYDSRRIIIQNKVSVSYGSDLDEVIRVMTGVGGDNPYQSPEPEVEVRVISFDDSGITMMLLTRIDDVNHKYRALSWNNLETWRRFKQEGISIPFPQIDLHLVDQKQDVRVVVDKKPAP